MDVNHLSAADAAHLRPTTGTPTTGSGIRSPTRYPGRAVTHALRAAGRVQHGYELAIVGGRADHQP
jgi:hypothetical protein